MRSALTTRLILAMLAVATVAFLFAALLTAPLVRSSAEQSAHTTLGRQADLIADLPRASRLTLRENARLDVRGLNLGTVTPAGRTTGAARALDESQVSRLLAGGSVSTTGRLGDRRVIVEARPLRNGGAVVLATGIREVSAAVAQQRERLLLALALGLVVALAVGAVIANGLGRPLARLAATARRMGAGERGAVTPEMVSGRGGTREVTDVADALLQLDVALQGSEERQRRFLLSVSHELRTPLTAVRGYAESLADGVTTGADVPVVAQTMVAEAQRLERYVDDLLALARLDADDFGLRAGPVDVAELAHETADAWAERAGREQVSVEARVTGEPPVVTSDRGRLRQVLDALVDNAVRVCPPGAQVVVAAAGHEGGVRLQVRDSGPGLSEEDAVVAFRPGALHAKYVDRAGGHGLGLAIVHRLVTRLGGTIQVGRAAEGGAAFVVDLPPHP
ncbi:sensor histidine kinase [Nocardioides mangrovicus]|uniref:histidine kinase n=1 Tax=Nocardioides mangrovicus TaxID=2478913 RepID=A0A3L8P7G3_9ACTN|nr:HAMP domain-containing sensor histidine kinase [Nocardioides mangrovicus]RLV50882.1 sensor histidine kinase [Nocardioides mangrovicus]